MTFRFLSCVLATVCCGIANGQEKTKKPPLNATPDLIGSSIIVLGHLNEPVGKELRIHGFKRSVPKDYSRFEVDAVDGLKLSKLVALSIDAVEKWPEGAEATMRGYEYGILRFSDIRGTGLASGAPFTPKQLLYLKFHPEQVVEGPPVAPKETAFDPKP
jgi:hypothetical protein